MRWVVVGAGPAGCVAAARLADDPKNEVVLVERGPDLPAGDVPPSVSARDFTLALADAERVDLDQVVLRGPDRRGPYTLGRGVGGSAAINAMVADHGDDEQYVGMGLGRRDEIDHAWRAAQIPHESPDQGVLGGVSRALLAAAGDARPPQLTSRDGRRVTAAEAYLWPRLGTSSLAVTADTTVSRVIVRDHRAVGVEIADGGAIEADRVVVAAGALRTPALLLRSGVRVPGLGENLGDHPCVTLVLRRSKADDPPDAPAIGAMLRRDGVQLTAMDRTRSGVAGLEHGALLIALMGPVRIRGTVGVEPGAAGAPLVRFPALPDDDVDRLSAGVATALDLLSTTPLAREVDGVYLDDVGTSAQALSDGGVGEWVRRSWSTLSHAAGTCAMGVVVGRDGAVVGHSGLYVCDASVFPVVPDVNTHLPTVMLAELLAARWRAAT